MLLTTVKTYNELSKKELYDLLQLRAEVFVVEQDCPYQDIDGKDQDALHILMYDKEILIAYTRVFAPSKYFTNASIGRVVVKQSYRAQKLGYDLMKYSIEAVKNRFDTTYIEISAQQYLIKFYNNLGFIEVGEGYLEDNIPHIKMIKK